MYFDRDHPVVQQNLGMAANPPASIACQKQKGHHKRGIGRHRHDGDDGGGGGGGGRPFAPPMALSHNAAASHYASHPTELGLGAVQSLGETRSKLWPPQKEEIIHEDEPNGSLPGVALPPSPAFQGGCPGHTGVGDPILSESEWQDSSSKLSPTHLTGVDQPGPLRSISPGPSPLLRASQGISFDQVARDAHEGPGAWPAARSRQQSTAGDAFVDELAAADELAGAGLGVHLPAPAVSPRR